MSHMQVINVIQNNDFFISETPVLYFVHDLIELPVILLQFIQIVYLFVRIEENGAVVGDLVPDLEPEFVGGIDLPLSYINEFAIRILDYIKGIKCNPCYNHQHHQYGQVSS